MRTVKVILIAASAAIMLSACNQFVPSKDYNELKDEYEMLKEASSETQTKYVEQAKAMDHIFTQLSAISRSTAALKGDIESGRAVMTEAEQIEESLDYIKSQLEELDKLTAKNKELNKVVSNLKQVIADKEEEIAQLKREISDKDATIESQASEISKQKETIDDQVETINRQLATIEEQNDKLLQQVEEQALLLFKAGVDFEEIADASPEVTFKKNKSKVSDWTVEMLNDALLYYTKALEYGYSRDDCADAIQRVNSNKTALSTN